MEASTAFVNVGNVKPENKPPPLLKSNSIEASESENKTRRKVVIGIGVVTFALVIMSILIMAITIHMTPSIDEKIRKEHEELVRKMSEGSSLKSTATSSNHTFHTFHEDELHK